MHLPSNIHMSFDAFNMKQSLFGFPILTRNSNKQIQNIVLMLFNVAWQIV